MRRRATSVRTRLTLWYSVALAVTMLLFSVAIYAAAQLSLDRSIDHQLDRLIGVFNTVMLNSPTELTDPHELSEIEAFGVITLFKVSTFDGVIHETAGWRQAGLDDAVAARNIGVSSPWAAGSGRRFFVKTAETWVRGTQVQIAAAVDGTSARDAMKSFWNALLIGFPCSLLLSVFGGHVLAGRALSPLSMMATKAQGITAEQLSDRLPVANPDDELGRLANAFNTTLARLEDSFRQLKQFTADASHELRTPLTALRSVGEVGLQEATEPHQLREVIGSMLEEADRLTQLVSALLTLTRADFGNLSVNRSAVDLAEMAETVAQDLMVLAEEKKQKMTVRVTGPVVVEVDPSIYRIALMNIVDNAIKYTPADGSIEITVEHGADGSAVVSVEDDGPGIPEGFRSRIFDRFVRVDDGRSSTNRGVGLGLSIAKWATEIHGGMIEMETVEGQGSVFRITLRPSAAQ